MTKVAQVWGLPLVPFTRAEATEAVFALIEAGRPSFFITANVHYAMLTAASPELARLNDRAAFLLADGAPLVVASRRGPVPLPERVAGSDMIYDLCRVAAERGRSIYLLGGAEGVAVEAARVLQGRYPGLRIVGTACPGPAELEGEGLARTIETIRAARPDLLMVALGQPKGEFWIDRNLGSLGVPVAVQVGATLDFVAGRVRRAPVFYQKIGMEWAYRISTDPVRLAPRYARNARFLLSHVIGDLLGGPERPTVPKGPEGEPAGSATRSGSNTFRG